ncbi:PREDICTED: uncharacterized protein LOC108748178 [Trachymyrmex septentrionalis]|uniref:uncharacterized protein LOC108748178 n=1 Tax=Trachymyrmex septentrionalis TaxID=34720 RepID=UPI00084F2A94|nr:PREDICTED: uncharacterized protein LOC108748178 [Trachymyrmex septentrionalis]
MGRAKAPKEIRVETWLIRDKISRYRGILKLHARDKKLQLSQATKLKSIVSKKITSLDVDVKRHYEIVSHLRDGGKQPILRLLTDKRVYLAVNHLKPSEIYAAIHQDCSSKRRLLDKLYYEKKKRLKRGIELQLEHYVLSTELEEQIEYRPNCEQQRLIAQLQRSIAKYKAAKDICSTYWSMLNILKKDAIFFDTLMNILKEDQSSQCKVMLKVTVMGQLAAENLDDIRQKYKRMSRVVWQNMKIREQMLSTVNSQVKDLWAYAQSLVRAESDHIFMKKDIDLFNKTLENQLAHLENICTEVKDVLLVRSYHDLLLRFENQSEHRVALLARLDINIKNREVLLSKKHHALQVLEGLKYSTKEQYKTNNTQDILEQIEIEKKREKDLREQITAHGELITHVRAALQNMNTMLLCFKHMKEMVKKPVKNAKKELMIINGKEDIEERDALAEVERMDTDVLALLSKISQKIHTLFNISNFELQGEKEDQARDLYHTYVSNYNSNLIFGTGEEEPIGLLVEHEMIDVAIPTRADIKYYSRQILEAHLKPE